MSATLSAEKTQVLENDVKRVPGYHDRYLVPVVVQSRAVADGPWAKEAALQYAKSSLRMYRPAVVAGTGGLATRFADYRAGAPVGQTRPLTVDEFRAASEETHKAAQAREAALKAGCQADDRWVVEVYVEDGE